MKTFGHKLCFEYVFYYISAMFGVILEHTCMYMACFNCTVLRLMQLRRVMQGVGVVRS